VTIVTGILGLIIWVIVQVSVERAARDKGVPLFSSKQMRYMRRKARRTGTTPDTVAYAPRTRVSPMFIKDWLGPDSLPTVHSTLTTPQSAPAPQETGERSRLVAVVAVIVGSVGVVGLMFFAGVWTPVVPAPIGVVPPGAASAAVTAQSQPTRMGRTKQDANVRAGPSNTAAILRTISASTSVRIIEVNGTWARVAIGEASPVGWVYRPLIE